MIAASLTDRQRREIDFHRDYSQRHEARRDIPVPMEVVTSARRRWWNAYWATYDLLRGHDLRGKRVLVPGCGFGEDAARLTAMGAEVYAFDISPEIVEIARQRCTRFGYAPIHFAVMPCETMDYADRFFDFVLCLDILHHVDIPRTVAEFQRVTKPGARIIGNELYTHGVIEKRIRRSHVVDKVLYPRMVKFIYGSARPYITEDEHKIDDGEFAVLRNAFREGRVDYFNIIVARLVPDRSASVAKLDRIFAKTLGNAGKLLAGRVIFDCSANLASA